MKTTLPKEAEIVHDWHLINAENKVLGRMATKIANLVRGQNQTDICAPH